MRTKKIIRIVLAVLLAVVLGGCLYLNSLMPIITGYAAKNLASAVFVSGRNQADVEGKDLNFSFIKYTHNKVDTGKKTVTSRFLWSKSIAAFREGYGVTLLKGRDTDAFLSAHYPLEPDTAVSSPLAPGDSAYASRLEPIAKALVDDQDYNGTPFAFVVLSKGKLVSERYRSGFSAQTRLLSWSMAKSFTNALCGLMTMDGLLDINAPTGIQEWQGDERKSITFKDLLQMQSGLQWNEDYGNRSDVNLMLHREKDMGLFAIRKKLEHTPGTYWYYSSGTSNIVMRTLRSKFSSDEAFLSYIRERLFLPLDIHNACFEPDMSGTPVGSSYLYATPMDFARFGQLYIDDGCVGDKRILPEGWVDFTATPASASEGRYGAAFWLNRGNTYPDAPEDLMECRGHDGQEIFIIPSKELVVVVLGYSPKPDHVIDWNRLLKDIIACQ